MTVATFANDATTNLWFQVVTNQTAEADTGLTRNVWVPDGAVDSIWYLNWTAKAGTTPLMDFAVNDVDPVDRTSVTPIEGWNGITQLSSEDLITVRIGPSYASTTVDDTGVDYHIGTTLGKILQAVITLDRTSGNETYTYSLSVVFR